jgi:hypothetical protein
MPDKNKKPGDSKEKMEQHKKSTDTARVKKKVSDDSSKKGQKTGTEHDDWDDLTGNTHLSDKS